jgi:uncharacterized protein YcbX
MPFTQTIHPVAATAAAAVAAYAAFRFIYFAGARGAASPAAASVLQPFCTDARGEGIAVSDLLIYPVKSLRGHSVAAAETDGVGFLNDRRWLLASAPPGAGPALFRTQRDDPHLATLSAHVLTVDVLAAVTAAAGGGGARLDGDAVVAVAHAAAAAAGRGATADGGVCPATAAEGAAAALLLVVDRRHNRAGHERVGDWALVPLVHAGDPGAVLRDAAVWSSTAPEAVDQGDAAAAFLAAVLPALAVDDEGRALRLLYQDPAWERGARAIRSSWMPLPAFLNPALCGNTLLRRLLRAAWWVVSGGGLSAATSFADGFPVLLAAEESLTALNAAASARAGAPPLPMARFRPNVVVRGGRAWEEDTWEEVRGEGGGLRMRGVKRCSRCVVTTTDQRSGAREDPASARAEPLATLDAIRASRNGPCGTLQVDGTLKAGGVFFGMNMLVAGDWAGRVLRVGERLRLVRVAAAPVGPL